MVEVIFVLCFLISAKSENFDYFGINNINIDAPLLFLALSIYSIIKSNNINISHQITSLISGLLIPMLYTSIVIRIVYLVFLFPINQSTFARRVLSYSNIAKW